MRITFLLPTRSHRPAGGFKVVYEHANRLVGRGHEVTVVHPWDCAPPADLRRRIRRRRWVLRWVLRPSRIAPWFEFDKRVRLRAAPDPSSRHLPDADVLVATAWHTAPWVDQAPPERGAGAYLIQGYETWDGAVEGVRETWRLPLRKLVISHWLEEIAADLGEAGRTTRVPLGMDLDRLGVDVPLDRRPPRLGGLYNGAPEKRSGEVVAAMVAAREGEPALSAVMFGTGARPDDLPSWIEYERLPSAEALRGLFNSCSVFVQASRSEGWGLPASEAILCGCALVTVANGGSREFAIDGETALVVSPDEAATELPAAIGRLFADPALRERLVTRGAELLRGFTWERASAELEAALAETVAAGPTR